jgi:hypothetical protein
MSMNLTSVTGDGLFDIQAKAIHAIDVLLAAAKTTVPNVVEDAVDQLNLVTPIPLTYEQAGSTIPTSLSSWQSSSGSLSNPLSLFCQNLLIAFVGEDSDLIDGSLTAALDYLIDQMEADGDYVTPNVVDATLTDGASNVGDTVVCWTLADGDGKDRQNAYAETITMTVGASPSATVPSITCVGESIVAMLNQDWPGGSGVNRAVSATSPASSLLTNGNFETSTYPDIPTGWIVAVGTVGTAVKLSAPEQQTVAISGTPTGGSYVLTYTDRNSQVWATAAIAWNATAGTVQTALRAIPDLAAATVTTTGTSPDFTHTIVFTGTGGNVDQLESINLLTGGTPSIAHATTVAGDSGDYRGTSLKLIGDDATLQALYAPLAAISLGTVYFAHLRILRSGTATGAVVKVAIVQGIGGAALDDDAGNANELEIDAAALSDSAYTSEWFSFRLPATAVLPVYLRIAVTTAIPTGGIVYVDEVAVTAGTELYSGGPYVAAFSGRTASREGDYWTLAVTNSRAGLWQTWYQRIMDMAAKGLMLPTTGSNLISQTELYPV